MKINWENLQLYIALSLVLALVVALASAIYRSATRHEKDRWRDVPSLTYLVKCPNVPDTQVAGTHMSTTIVGSDHIHIYNKKRVVGMFPPQCVVSAQ